MKNAKTKTAPQREAPVTPKDRKEATGSFYEKNKRTFGGVESGVKNRSTNKQHLTEFGK
ncbi:MAG: hypothetical protein JNJ94_13080 [Chlorobi bacterium]|nr:hypothetical protein [Chlorobiota bacterium]